MFTAYSPRVEREAREKSKRLREWGEGVVTYMAPEITASSRRDTGFGWQLHMVSEICLALLDAGNLRGRGGIGRLPDQ